MFLLFYVLLNYNNATKTLRIKYNNILWTAVIVIYANIQFQVTLSYRTIKTTFFKVRDTNI